MKYKVEFPFTYDMGQVADAIVWDNTVETKEEMASTICNHKWGRYFSLDVAKICGIIPT